LICRQSRLILTIQNLLHQTFSNKLSFQKQIVKGAERFGIKLVLDKSNKRNSNFFTPGGEVFPAASSAFFIHLDRRRKINEG